MDRLIAKKDSEIVIDQMIIDDDFIELDYEKISKEIYSTESENMFRDLTELSELPIYKTSS